MVDAEKTVFISYRRNVSRHLARSIFQDLNDNGFDAFLDVNSADNGALDSIILNQIAARPHFIIVVSPGSLERCQNEGDWVRREIEEAIRLGRNIVPIIEEGFPFEDEVRKYLPKKLSDDFLRLNGVRLFHDYFDAGMQKLRDHFLKKPVYNISIKPTPIQEQAVVSAQIEQAKRGEIPDAVGVQSSNGGAGTATEQDRRRAVELADRAVKLNYKLDADSAIRDLTEAIRLDPEYARAYEQRGVAYSWKDDFQRAIQDYNEAIRLKPDLSKAYLERGKAYVWIENISRAIEDYNEAIRLKADYIEALFERGKAYARQGDQRRAAQDLSDVIRLDPKHIDAYYERGKSYVRLEEYRSAINDFSETVRLNPAFAEGYEQRGVAYNKLGDYNQAIAEQTEAIRLNPTFAKAYYERGLDYSWIKNYDLAIADFDHAIRIDPDYAAAFRERGVAYHWKQNYESAIIDYTKAIELGYPDREQLEKWIADCKTQLP